MKEEKYYDSVVQSYLRPQYAISTKCLGDLTSPSTTIYKCPIGMKIRFHSSIDHFMKHLGDKSISFKT